eukprot:TRINITY_DN767_c0_g1_i4.p3 TRINITY_DN767_c0_g1~~TRINITY_DN767_c0_g1_i4.p3  ORF type:complete len:215 (-),score=-6.14 TRINITY_DN767_c0_g1_i4:2219-2863(-)
MSDARLFFTYLVMSNSKILEFNFLLVCIRTCKQYAQCTIEYTEYYSQFIHNDNNKVQGAVSRSKKDKDTINMYAFIVFLLLHSFMVPSPRQLISQILRLNHDRKIVRNEFSTNSQELQKESVTSHIEFIMRLLRTQQRLRIEFVMSKNEFLKKLVQISPWLIVQSQQHYAIIIIIIIDRKSFCSVSEKLVERQGFPHKTLSTISIFDRDIIVRS